ncbi:hypothetical protein [Trueperella pyogenes]|uniref:hypothetical protein n=1 Tax=Trueperella pyogenes TaxID=1661 RepID=UPI003248EA5E
MKRTRRHNMGNVAKAVCATTLAFVSMGSAVALAAPDEPDNAVGSSSHGDAAPGQSAAEPEKHASTKDSDERRWGGIDGKRFGDSIRKTERVTYPDAGIAPQSTCDVTGDLHNDLIFINATYKELFVVPYIPYGDKTDGLERSIAKQPEVLRFQLPHTIDGTNDWRISCVKTQRGVKASLALANSTNLYITKPEQLNASGALPIHSHYQFVHNISAISPITPGIDEVGLVVSAGENLYYYKSLPAGQAPKQGADKATKIWTLDDAADTVLAPLGYVLDKDVTIGVGIPSRDHVYALPLGADSGNIDDVAMAVTGTEATSFGSSLVGISDVNGDEVDDFAIGAPKANGGAGAIGVIYGGKSSKVAVDLSATTTSAVRRDGETAGTLLRQVARGRIGTHLAFIPGVDEDRPGALVVSRPDHEEHPGALIISASVLSTNWNTGAGIDGIPASSMVWLASDEGKGDGGYFVGSIPSADDDKQLSAVMTGDSHGKINVWTVDMTRQGQITKPVEPLHPQPPAPQAEPGYTPLDTDTAKSWLGEFTSGFGGALARGRCDVTGDGKPDLISGSAPRSEWKFDPYYEDSTPTHGWVFNVTGEIQIIPGGAPGGSLPMEKVISIVGPRRTQDPAADAAIGLSVACLGDVNADGTDDIAFSSHTMGRVWVIYGGPTLANTNLEELTSDRGYYIDMPYETGSAGYQVTRVGDVDGDGLADVGFVVANTSAAMKEKGKTYGTAFIVKGNKTGTVVDLRDLTGKNDHVICRIHTPDGHTLSAFSPVGDVNGDGKQDYALADFNWFNTKGIIAGTSWIVYGNDDVVDLQMPYAGYRLRMSEDASYRLGAGNSIVPAGDVNNDGLEDFLIGFDGGSLAHQSKGGAVLVYGTREQVKERQISLDAQQLSDGIRVLTGNNTGDGFGWAIDASDGLAVIGAWGEGNGGVAHVVRIAQIPVGVTSIADMPNTVIIQGKAQKSRFGRSVAFVGNYLGKPTVAIGGDGVIDEALTDTEGYAHAAHILATVLPPVGAQNQDENQNPSDSTVPKAPHPTEITDSPATLAASDGASKSKGLPVTGVHILSLMIVTFGLGALGILALLLRRAQH